MKPTSIIIFIFLLSICTPYQKAHSWNRKARVLFVEDEIDYDLPWTRIGKTTTESIKKLIKLLERSKTGLKLLRKAQRKAQSEGHSLEDIIKPNSISTADTTLIRRFYPENPDKVSYETRSLVYIDKNHLVIDAVLDLAHELTHYAHRTLFNPYRLNFNLMDFIKSTVAGKGGEVDAYIMECKVYFELFSKENRSDSNCLQLIDPRTGKFSHEIAERKFYRVGPYYKVLKDELKRYGIFDNQIASLDQKQALYISSAYDLPYPYAALKEYNSIMRKVCRNDLKRLDIMKDSIRRMIASSDKDRKQHNYYKMKKSYQSRCLKYYSADK